MDEVSEFIVVGPARRAAQIELSQERLVAFLAERFPHYGFQVTAWAPFMDDEDFTVIPLMNRAPRPGDQTHNGVMFLCKPLDPEVVPGIVGALREFKVEADSAN